MSDRPSAAARIMVVDDTPQNLTLLQDILRKHGYEVFALPNGEIALKAALCSSKARFAEHLGS